MMRKQYKTLIAMCLAGSMAASALSGCGSSGTEEAKETTEVAAVSEEVAEDADSSESEGVKKLVVAIQQSAYVTDYDDNHFTNALEEEIGAEIEFILLPEDPGEFQSKLSLMAAAGDDLPDLLFTGGALSIETILQYGKQGLFLPIEEYIYDAELMPNYNSIPQEDLDFMNEASTMADGHIYSLGHYEQNIWNEVPFRTFINKTWLDTLGLEVPTTTDELYDVLVAFRDGDPNGNGKQDEIGVYGYQSGVYGYNVLATLMNTFIAWNNNNQNGGLMLDTDDGKTVIAPYTQEEWREGLRYMRKLYEENLLSPSIFTDDDSQFRATVNAEPNIVGFVSFGSLSRYENDADGNKKQNFLDLQIIDPLIGPEGVQYTPYAFSSSWQAFFVFRGCEDVELAMKLGDAFFSQKVKDKISGEYGVDWTDDPEICGQYTNGYVYKGMVDSISRVDLTEVDHWASPNNWNWRDNNPEYRSLEEEMSTVDASLIEEFDPDDPEALADETFDMYYPRRPEPALPVLKYTEEESEVITDAVANIPSFVEQTMAEFITGARDLDNGWDDYIAEINSMGLEEWIAIAQASYDRTTAE